MLRKPGSGTEVSARGTTHWSVTENMATRSMRNARRCSRVKSGNSMSTLPTTGVTDNTCGAGSFPVSPETSVPAALPISPFATFGTSTAVHVSRCDCSLTPITKPMRPCTAAMASAALSRPTVTCAQPRVWLSLLRPTRTREAPYLCSHAKPSHMSTRARTLRLSEARAHPIRTA